jgi:hypothetical protein
MSDDIDIGLGVYEKSGSQALIEAVRQKLQAYRQELQNLVDFEAEYGQHGSTGIEGSFRAINAEVNDVITQFLKMGSTIDITNAQAVKAFREEAVELRNYLESIDAAGAAIDRLNNGLTALNQASQRANEGLATGAASTPAAQAGPALAEASAGAAQADAEVQRLATDVNIAIGAFVRMAQVVDISSKEAVTAFRAEGDALAANLVRLGATDAELNRIGTAIAGVERAYGANTVAINENNASVDKIPVTARRGANAFATLAFGLAAGGTSARSAAIAIGSAVSATAAFAESARIAAAASGIGALITVLATVIGLFYDLNKEEKQSADFLNNIGNLRADQLKILEQTARANADVAQQAAAAAAAQVEANAQSLNPIKNVEAAFQTFRARQLQDHYNDLLAIQKKYTDARIAAEEDEQKRLEEQGRKEIEKAQQQETERLQGPAAARRLAADQELADSLRELAKETGFEKDRTAAISGLRRQHAETIAKIDQEEEDKRRVLFEKLQSDRLKSEAALEQDSFQVRRDEATRRQQQAAEEITKNRDLNAKQRHDAIVITEQTLTADLTKIERDRQEEIRHIVEDAQGKLDEIGGTGVDEEKIRNRYKTQLQVLQAAIASTSTSDAVKEAARQGIALINQLIPQEVAEDRIKQIEKQVSATITTSEQDVTRINALVAAHGLTEEQARTQIVDALNKQKQAIEDILPELEQEAALLPGDAEAQAKVEQYKTKLLELKIAIAQTSDEFYNLRVAGVNATEDAIAKMITSVPSLIQNNSEQVNNINAMRVHLASAEAELADLMKGPQTEASAQRITQLRAEIQGVNIDLNNAKQSLTTWKDLFLDAARSIVSALFEVEAKMFAVYLVQKTLGLFGGGGGGLSAVTQLAGDVAGASIGVASGGLVTGPGTSTSDSIPARLSTGEYVINARAVSRAGVGFLNAINSLGSMGTIRPRRYAGFAGGGLVTTTDQTGEGGSKHELTLGLEDGVVLKKLESSAGEATLFKVLEKNRNKLRSLIG